MFDILNGSHVKFGIFDSLILASYISHRILDVPIGKQQTIVDTGCSKKMKSKTISYDMVNRQYCSHIMFI